MLIDSCKLSGFSQHIHMAWASSQHGMWVPRVSVPWVRGWGLGLITGRETIIKVLEATQYGQKNNQMKNNPPLPQIPTKQKNTKTKN